MRRWKLVDRYLGTRFTTLDEVRPALWTEIGPPAYADGLDKYQAAVLEQYRIFVEIADRVSARRGVANTFFLTLNTVVLTTLTVLWRDRPGNAAGYLVVPLCALLLQCGAWFWLLRSYRQLSAAKSLVIGALEERLPASPYWRAEWSALGEGRDLARYWPLTRLEQWIPVSFALVYVLAFVVALAG
jgi:hypothetical protein